MLNLLHQMGGVAMLSLIVAVVPGVMGAAYAIWPNERKLAMMRPLSLAGLFGALGGFVAGVINMLHSTAGRGTSLTSGPALYGLAESLVPLFIAFGSLTVGWLLVALGLRRSA